MTSTPAIPIATIITVVLSNSALPVLACASAGLTGAN